MFQSTHPHGVRLIVVVFDYSMIGVNPRTHTGCDGTFALLFSFPDEFQSTHPHGVRHFFSISSTCSFVFQSTHPHGVRQRPSRGRWTMTGCFNPRTHTGCDKSEIEALSIDLLFQSTHPHGVRRSTTGIRLVPACFNPRTHTGCDFCCINAYR